MQHKYALVHIDLYETISLSRAVVPIIQGYEDAGDFTLTERLKTSLHANLFFHMCVGSIALCGLILLIILRANWLVYLLVVILHNSIPGTIYLIRPSGHQTESQLNFWSHHITLMEILQHISSCMYLMPLKEIFTHWNALMTSQRTTLIIAENLSSTGQP